MLNRYLEKLCGSRRVLRHMAMVQRDMTIARSAQNPLVFGYTDYIG